MSAIGQRRTRARVPRVKAPPGATTTRGYGWSHQKERAKWAAIIAANGAICWRCKRIIRPGDPWDLGHHDIDRTRYMGPEHAACNRAAAAQSKARRRMASQRRRSPALRFFDT